MSTQSIRGLVSGIAYLGIVKYLHQRQVSMANIQRSRRDLSYSISDDRAESFDCSRVPGLPGSKDNST